MSFRTRKRAPKVVYRQLSLPFVRRQERLERRFKRAIAFTTLLALAGMVGGSDVGRSKVSAGALRAKWLLQSTLGLAPSREDIAADWMRKRALGIAQTKRVLSSFYDGTDPGIRKLMHAAGMAPENGLIRWGNYNQTLLLPSGVFEADDTGRAYRLRPRTRAFWLRQITLLNGPRAFFLVPDTPEVREAMKGTSAIIVEDSEQNTNSWGCRGEEPRPDAPVRGLVVGDSYMQGMFIGDRQTPAYYLERTLAEAWQLPVSILNTGHLGYSPEQYFYTLKEYGERFKPHFVVLALFANDFGEILGTLKGQAEWGDAEYWIGQMHQYCRSSEIPMFVSVIPLETQLLSTRREAHYQGQLSNLWKASSNFFVNPLDAFIDEHLRLVAEGQSAGHRPTYSLLYNGQYHDGHFSARGAELWGRCVARRIERVVDAAGSSRLADRVRQAQAAAKASAGEPLTARP